MSNMECRFKASSEDIKKIVEFEIRNEINHVFRNRELTSVRVVTKVRRLNIVENNLGTMVSYRI